jgi:hypothetical protein
LRALRVKRWAITALYAGVELRRAWHNTLANVGADVRYIRKQKYLRRWRDNAATMAEAAAVAEDHESTAGVYTRPLFDST